LPSAATDTNEANERNEDNKRNCAAEENSQREQLLYGSSHAAPLQLKTTVVRKHLSLQTSKLFFLVCGIVGLHNKILAIAWQTDACNAQAALNTRQRLLSTSVTCILCLLHLSLLVQPRKLLRRLRQCWREWVCLDCFRQLFVVQQKTNAVV